MTILLERDSAGPLSWKQVQASMLDNLGATREDTFAQNPFNQLQRIDALGSANSVGDPTAPEYVAPVQLPAADARTRAAQSGVTLKIPDSGINEAALQILISNKKDEAAREKALTSGPQGMLPGAARLATSFAASAMDPLNIASGFIPVIPEARAAALLAERGVAARAAIRAGIGAAEGGVGQALLEPLSLLSHSQDQADYSMGDSLRNIAFGGVFGAGIHVGGGALMDMVGRNLPRPGEALPPAIGGGEPIVPRETALGAAPDPAARAQEIFAQMRRGELSAEQVSALVKSEPDAMALIAKGITPEVGMAAPFAKLTPEAARARAVAELAPDIKADLLGTAGNRAAPGDVPALRAQVTQLQREVETLQSEDAFKTEAKAQQAAGASRKQAESGARKAIADRQAEAQAKIDAANAQLDANRQASQAEQAAAAVDKGEVPAQHEAAVAARAAEHMASADIGNIFSPPPEASARFQIGQADWQTRQTAFSTALGQMMDGRQIDVDPIFASAPGARRPMTPEQVTAAGQRQAQPEGARVADFQAAKAADERLAAAPKGEPLQAAEAAAEQAETAARDVLKNLEQSGMDPKRVAAMADGLKPFDEAIAEADALGAGVRAAALCGLRN